MNKTLTNLLMFTAGATIGSLVTWKLVKTKYEKIVQEEINNSLQEKLSKRPEPVVDEEVVNEEENTEVHIDDIREYAKHLTNNLGYTDYTNIEEGVDESKMDAKNKPRVIEPDELGESDYPVVSLTYYADGVLADDWDDIIEDIEEKVGLDFSEHFGEYEDDSVFIRNDELETDYEICRDLRSYSDVAGDPHSVDD